MNGRFREDGPSDSHASGAIAAPGTNVEFGLRAAIRRAQHESAQWADFVEKLCHGT